MKTVFILIILKFSTVGSGVGPIEFPDLKQCEAAKAALVAEGIKQGYYQKALVAACVRRTYPSIGE